MTWNRLRPQNGLRLTASERARRTAPGERPPTAGLVLTGVSGAGTVAVVVEGAVALVAATVLLAGPRPAALAAGTFLAGAGGLLIAGGVVVAAAGAPPVVGLAAGMAVAGVLMLVPVLAGAPPARLAAGVGLPGCLAVAAFGVVGSDPTAAGAFAGALGEFSLLAPEVLLVEVFLAGGALRLWVGRAVSDGFVAPDGRLARSRRPLTYAVLVPVLAVFVIQDGGGGLGPAAADGAVHAGLFAAISVTTAGYAATVLLGAAGVPALRRPAGWLAALAGAAAVLLGAFALPAAVGAAAGALVTVLPGFLALAGVLTDAAGSAGAVRTAVTPLVVLLAVAPAFVTLAAAVAGERSGGLRGERGLAGAAAGLLATAALLSAVFTRDPARTVAALAVALLVWDFAEYGLSVRELLGRARPTPPGLKGPTTDGVVRAARRRGVPRVERGHAAASLAVAGVAVALTIGVNAVVGGAGGAGGGAPAVLLIAGAAVGLLALRERDAEGPAGRDAEEPADRDGAEETERQ